jgi:hypothetical protein
MSFSPFFVCLKLLIPHFISLTGQSLSMGYGAKVRRFFKARKKNLVDYSGRPPLSTNVHKKRGENEDFSCSQETENPQHLA